jgi:peptidoglycan/LPS O-acetylase OafA/YrhL
MYLVLIVALLMIGYLVVYAGKDVLGPRVGHERLLAAASGINLLLVLIAVVFKPPGVTPMVKVSWNMGAFVGLIAAIVAVAPLARSGLRARQSRLSR